MTIDKLQKANNLNKQALICAINIDTIDKLMNIDYINKIGLTIQTTTNTEMIDVPESFYKSFLQELRDYYSKTLETVNKEFAEL